MKYITVEEHFASPGFLAGPGTGFKEQVLKVGFLGEKLLENLREVGSNRLSQMDAAGIDMQVLSLNYPGVEQSEAAEAIAIAREANDFLKAAVESNPTRFAALAAVPMSAPEEAATELELRVKQHGFKGAIINGHARGRYLDDKFFWPVLERAEALDVPIYLHPTLPTRTVIESLYSGFSPAVNFLLAGPAWGWHIETGIHVIRMILGGVFDRFPKLQVVIGHMGEGLPFMLPRLNEIATFCRRIPSTKSALHVRGVQLSRYVSESGA